MTEEESALFGGTSNLTFHQVQELDAMRSCALADQARMKGKGKANFLHDPNLPAWTVKIKNIHLPSGTVPMVDSASGQSIDMNEATDLKRAIEESLEFERIRKAKAEREHQEILAQITQIKEAELKHMWDKMDEEHEQNRRERNKRHKL